MEKIKRIKEKLLEEKEIYSFGTIALSLIVVILIMYKMELSSNILPYTSHKSRQDEIQIVENFITGMEIKQSFQSYVNFDFISFNFVDHDKRLKGKLGVIISDKKNDKNIIYKEIDINSIYHTVPVLISFDTIGGGKKNTDYEIRLVSADTGKEALGIYGHEEKNNTAIINGKESKYALSFGIHSNTLLYFNICKIILFISSIMIFIMIISTCKYKLSEEKIFLILAIPFIMSMIFLWPGNEVYDQGRHINTVYHYTNLLLGCGEVDEPNILLMRKCDIIDKEELEILNTPDNGQAQAYYYFLDKMWNIDWDGEMKLVDISDNPLVTDGLFIQYTPAIIGMTIARILGCNYFWMMTLTRLSIMIFYIVMCFYAIYKIPIMKMMIVFLSALPMNLYQVSGVSYDSFTFAVGIVVISFLIRLWKSGLQKKDWILFVFSVFLLGNCKGGVYLTLLLLMLFIPKECFSRNKWIKVTGILSWAGVSMLISYLPTIIAWTNFSVARHQGTEAASVVINTGGMVSQKLSPIFAISDPIKFLEMFIKTMINNLDIYLGQMLGYRTAWSNKPLPIIVMLPFLILLILSVIEKEELNLKISFERKMAILGLILLQLVGLQIIFLAETPVHSETIRGFQGRYFILFLPYILLLFKNEGLVFKGRKENLYIGYSMAQLVYWYFFLRMFMMN